MPRSSRCEAADTRNTGVPSSQSAPAAASLGPEPVPHPDDVIIDYRTGEVRIDGPVMEEQKAAGEQLKALWPHLERDLMEINKQIESDPNDVSLRKLQKELMMIVSWLRDGSRHLAGRDLPPTHVGERVR
jgi:hypothetical protein